MGGLWHSFTHLSNHKMVRSPLRPVRGRRQHGSRRAEQAGIGSGIGKGVPEKRRNMAKCSTKRWKTLVKLSKIIQNHQFYQGPKSGPISQLVVPFIARRTCGCRLAGPWPFGNSRASRGCKDSCSQNSCDGCDGHVTDVKTTKARFEKCGKILEKQTVANGSLGIFWRFK